MRPDLYFQVQITSLATAAARTSLTAQSYPRTCLNSSRDFGFDFTAVFPFQGTRRAVERLFQRNLNCVFQVTTPARPDLLLGKTAEVTSSLRNLNHLITQFKHPLKLLQLYCG